MLHLPLLELPCSLLLTQIPPILSSCASVCSQKKKETVSENTRKIMSAVAVVKQINVIKVVK